MRALMLSMMMLATFAATVSFAIDERANGRGIPAAVVISGY
jgi:hypothetical protein